MLSLSLTLNSVTPTVVPLMVSRALMRGVNAVVLRCGSPRTCRLQSDCVKSRFMFACGVPSGLSIPCSVLMTRGFLSNAVITGGCRVKM